MRGHRFDNETPIEETVEHLMSHFTIRCTYLAFTDASSS